MSFQSARARVAVFPAHGGDGPGMLERAAADNWCSPRRRGWSVSLHQAKPRMPLAGVVYQGQVRVTDVPVTT